MHIQMELKPTDNNTCSSESHEVFDDHLEKIVQEFNEFQGRMSEKCCNGSMRLEDLIDMYINSGGVIVNSPVDLTESESDQVQSAHGFSINREIQESDIMIDEIMVREDTSQNDTGNFPDSSATVKTHSRVGAGGNNLKVTHIRYGDLNCPGVADSVIGSVSGCSAETVFRSVMKSFRTPAGAGGKNLWQQVGVKESGGGTTSREIIKRKYKQITETEEETASRMEITTIKNRESSAKACAKKQLSSNTTTFKYL
ncbi:hypothetical protein C2S53_005364 [Perilla frutescens var. hirtella]|uniref:Uncharacterized protein n=1 Tax=Perilla frutescens var. hirtella TaxID=608512 RepID=A0AAD4PBZ5_PERFH|nr:hypothetical protein C2S53_005364 [Perilla frutescens var. hirtella]